MKKVDVDILNMYLKEVNEFPILSEEEEKLHAKNLKLFDEISFLKRVRYVKEDFLEILDLDLIFYSLDKNNYEEILNTLISYFKYKEEYKVLYEKLMKYKNISSKLDRPLNEEELKSNFDIDECKKIDSIELLDQVKKYIIYQTSFNKLYESNLRFVVAIVRKHNNISFDFLELINEGNLGLRRAIQKFDCDKDNRLGTYASYWINCRVMRYYYSHKNMLVSSTGDSRDFQMINKKIDELENIEGTLTVDEIAEKLNISPELVKYAKLFSAPITSLSFHPDDDENSSIYDFLTDGISAEDELLKKVEINLIDELVNKLDDKKREIIKYRFGFCTNVKMMSLQEIGSKLNISKQATQVQEQKALRILRKEFNDRGLVK